MNLDSFRMNYLLSLYYYGDQVGAVAEGAGGGTISYEKALTGVDRFPNGTDESDIVRLAVEFWKDIDGDYLGRYGSMEKIVEWYCYHEKARSVCKYGRTWKDHFSLVKHLNMVKGVGWKESIHNKFIKISSDRGSNGNGALAMVFPMWVTGNSGIRVVEGTHSEASDLCGDLSLYFCGDLDLDHLKDCCAEACIPHTELADGCLYEAINVAQQDSVEDGVKYALCRGGDVDSYLSLGLLLWGFERLDKNG